jgi:hypothetical protein
VYREFFTAAGRFRQGGRGTPMSSQSRPAGTSVGGPATGGSDLARRDPADQDPAHPPESPPTALLVVTWLFLVALAVVGRAWQPAAHVTPLAAVALAAGAFFPSTLAAASVPVAALAIGNIFLAGYGSLAMAVTVYAALSWPVVLGRIGLLGGAGRETRWGNVVGGALASSLVFFFATNTAHWLLTDDYPRSAAGLVSCLAAGLPFQRWMPVGDVAWSLAVFGLLAGMVAAGDVLAARRLAVASISKRETA